jgi:uncharacterized membrane protein
MAEPGDPSNADDHDDLIGFASPASLQGRTREPKAEPVEVPERVTGPEPTPDLFTTPAATTPSAAPEPRPEPEVIAPKPAPAPVEAEAVFQRAPEASMNRRRRDPGARLPGGGMGLYAVYALILFAVPTMGVAAIIGLLAVTGRSGPEDALSRSHFIYQQRTLWTAAVAAVSGLILLAAPFALGVPILFLLALWLVLRGASGVWALKSGHAIADPRGWWI